MVLVVSPASERTHAQTGGLNFFQVSRSTVFTYYPAYCRYFLHHGLCCCDDAKKTPPFQGLVVIVLTQTASYIPRVRPDRCVWWTGFCVLENRLEISARAKKELVPAFGNVTHLECGGTSSARYT